MGTCTLVKHRQKHQKYVVKKIALDALTEQERRGAQQECELLKGLSHPNIVEYIGSVLDEECKVSAGKPFGGSETYMHSSTEALSTIVSGDLFLNPFPNSAVSTLFLFSPSRSLLLFSLSPLSRAHFFPYSAPAFLLPTCRQWLYIVMQYCAGGDLSSHIKAQARSGRRFEEPQVLDWFVQVVLAVGHIHTRRILHRDLKTNNVFLTDKNIVKLGDFGIARVLDTTMEQAETVIGTPYYMSPEVCENRPYSYKSDIWALGCILYELCTLKHAFKASNLLGIVFKIVAQDAPPIPEMYSEQMASLVSSLLQKKPEERPSVADILERPYVRRHIGGMSASGGAFADRLGGHHGSRNGSNGGSSIANGNGGGGNSAENDALGADGSRSSSWLDSSRRRSSGGSSITVPAPRRSSGGSSIDISAASMSPTAFGSGSDASSIDRVMKRKELQRQQRDREYLQQLEATRNERQQDKQRAVEMRRRQFHSVVSSSPSGLSGNRLLAPVTVTTPTPYTPPADGSLSSLAAGGGGGGGGGSSSGSRPLTPMSLTPTSGGVGTRSGSQGHRPGGRPPSELPRRSASALTGRGSSSGGGGGGGFDGGFGGGFASGGGGGGGGGGEYDHLPPDRTLFELGGLAGDSAGAYDGFGDSKEFGELPRSAPSGIGGGSGRGGVGGGGSLGVSPAEEGSSRARFFSEPKEHQRRPASGPPALRGARSGGGGLSTGAGLGGGGGGSRASESRSGSNGGSNSGGAGGGVPGAWAKDYAYGCDIEESLDSDSKHVAIPAVGRPASGTGAPAAASTKYHQNYRESRSYNGSRSGHGRHPRPERGGGGGGGGGDIFADGFEDSPDLSPASDETRPEERPITASGRYLWEREAGSKAKAAAAGAAPAAAGSGPWKRANSRPRDEDAYSDDFDSDRSSDSEGRSSVRRASISNGGSSAIGASSSAANGGGASSTASMRTGTPRETIEAERRHENDVAAMIKTMREVSDGERVYQTPSDSKDGDDDDGGGSGGGGRGLDCSAADTAVNGDGSGGGGPGSVSGGEAAMAAATRARRREILAEGKSARTFLGERTYEEVQRHVRAAHCRNDPVTEQDLLRLVDGDRRKLRKAVQVHRL
ncbi:unnamed protein product, partial [Phaeothamnion confervicola]